MKPRPPVARSADRPTEAPVMRRVDGVEALPPDMPTVARSWGCRTDDVYYRAECTVAQIGMTIPQSWMHFSFVGAGELDPINARAGMNMRIGRAGLRVIEVILHPVTFSEYAALADREG